MHNFVNNLTCPKNRFMLIYYVAVTEKVPCKSLMITVYYFLKKCDNEAMKHNLFFAPRKEN